MFIKYFIASFYVLLHQRTDLYALMYAWYNLGIVAVYFFVLTPGYQGAIFQGHWLVVHGEYIQPVQREVVSIELGGFLLFASFVFGLAQH